MAVGGAATLAGWLLGTALFGAGWRIESVTVSRPSHEALDRAKRLAREAATLIGCEAELQKIDVTIHDGFIGEGYGAPSKEGQEAISLSRRAPRACFSTPSTRARQWRAFARWSHSAGWDASRQPCSFTPAACPACSPPAWRKCYDHMARRIVRPAPRGRRRSVRDTRKSRPSVPEQSREMRRGLRRGDRSDPSFRSGSPGLRRLSESRSRRPVPSTSRSS